jgi:hypothetical protein
MAKKNANRKESHPTMGSQITRTLKNREAEWVTGRARFWASRIMKGLG